MRSEKLKRHSKRFARMIVLLMSLLVILAVGTGLMLTWLLSPVAGRATQEEMTVRIPAEATSRQIAGILHDLGLIRHPLVFQQYTRWKNLDSSLQAGTYQLSTGLSVQSMAGLIVAGSPDLRTFTIPEGYTIQQVARLLSEAEFVDQDSFLVAVAQAVTPFPETDTGLTDYRRLEGYLFPDTYTVGSKINEEELLDLMVGRFALEMDRLDYRSKAAALGMTVHEAVTLASMIEREARVHGERSLIAGVIHNRLRIGMPLQIDATVQYALGEHRPVIYYRDLEVDSPYNTYRINGLPPGPIAAPGSASLMAAVEPETTNYLYYVARPDGSHAFARTLAEHNANKRKYLQ